jgi:transposase
MDNTIKTKLQYDHAANEGKKEQVLKVEGEERKFASKSEMFKYMYDMGATVGDISAITKCHYSFVYGVISSCRTIQKQEQDSKSDKIRAMVDKGMTPGAIAKELNSNYSFVHSVVTKYKKQLTQTAVAGGENNG